MADTSPAPGRWAFRPIPPEPRPIVELIADGTLDAELAAQLWLLGPPSSGAAVGEGSMAIAFVHQYLAGERTQARAA